MIQVFLREGESKWVGEGEFTVVGAEQKVTISAHALTVWLR
jgi:hypothetical protein